MNNNNNLNMNNNRDLDNVLDELVLQNPQLQALLNKLDNPMRQKSKKWNHNRNHKSFYQTAQDNWLFISFVLGGIGYLFSIFYSKNYAASPVQPRRTPKLSEDKRRQQRQKRLKATGLQEQHWKKESGKKEAKKTQAKPTITATNPTSKVKKKLSKQDSILGESVLDFGAETTANNLVVDHEEKTIETEGLDDNAFKKSREPCRFSGLSCSAGRILCEAFSSITKSNVHVKILEPESRVWIPRKNFQLAVVFPRHLGALSDVQSTALCVELQRDSLHPDNVVSWFDVALATKTTTSEASAATTLALTTLSSMNQLIRWHSAAVQMQHHGFSPFILAEDEERFPQFRSILEIFSNKCIEAILEIIRSDHNYCAFAAANSARKTKKSVTATATDDDDDDDDGDDDGDDCNDFGDNSDGNGDDDYGADNLFSDGYGDSDSKKKGVGPVEVFLGLLEGYSVKPELLNDIFRLEGSLAPFLLKKTLDRLAPHSINRNDDGGGIVRMGGFSQRLNALLNLVTHSSTASEALTRRFRYELNRMKGLSGKEIEQRCACRHLFRLVAFAIPEPGEENYRNNKPLTMFQQDMVALKGFPQCVFQKQLPRRRTGRLSQEEENKKAMFKLIEQYQQLMNFAKMVAIRVLKNIGKQVLFEWIGCIVRSNYAMSSLLMGDLLAEDGIPAVSSSRKFLLGVAISVLEVCCESPERVSQLDFDLRYLMFGKLGLEKNEPKLFHSSDRDQEDDDALGVVRLSQSVSFAGITELFFLSAGMLRVSLQPAHRSETAFYRQYKQIFDALSGGRGAQVNSIAKKPVAAYLGWHAFLGDRKTSEIVIDFTLLQLQWLVKEKKNLAGVPEWMCKEPCIWLADSTESRSHLLKPRQAKEAVECVIELLQLGTKSNTERSFSPVVATQLVDVLATFVRASVNKAQQRDQQRYRSIAHEEADRRDAHIYTSLDRADLGVTVFTNPRVSNELCPTLIQTFEAADIVEGLDVDREHNFDKYSAKVKIADLFLRLWQHPNGECKKSVLRMPPAALADFAKSIAASIGQLFDDACLRLKDVCREHKKMTGPASLRRYTRQHLETQQFLAAQTKGANGNYSASRTLMLLLMKLSAEKKIAKTFARVAPQLTTMVVHNMDLLTNEQGGTNSDLSFVAAESHDLLDEDDQGTGSLKLKGVVRELIAARFRAFDLLGLDVSVLSHQFLAMLSWWHKASKQGDNCSAIVDSLYSNDDFEFGRYKNVFKRLVLSVSKKTAEDGRTTLVRDGYVDFSKFKSTNDDNSIGSQTKQLQVSARQDQMSHQQIGAISDIKEFFSDLDQFIQRRAVEAPSTATVSFLEAQNLAKAIVQTKAVANDEDYGKWLSEWTVSSESFASDIEPQKFSHYYDETARTRSGTGKGLLKEARRCYRTLPFPHPNSASFVCFGEERMDLCRAAITGPVDTPYAHGLFVFDAFYPPDYPNIPPLVTFMTTGGGQTRFNPNLYQDGKVCLSLLGTFHASDESQKWNPNLSSMAQVVLSIQTQLLVEEPIFNEPGYESVKDSPIGRERSRLYNLNLKLATLRHAILAPMRKPPVGFEEIAKRHFDMCRHRIVVQARKWVEEAKDTNLYSRFKKTFGDLMVAFSLLKSESPALLPLKEDVRAMKSADGGLFHVCARKEVLSKQTGERTSPHSQHSAPGAVAGAVTTPISQPSGNPWASGSTSSLSFSAPGHSQATNSNNEDGDDEDFYS